MPQSESNVQCCCCQSLYCQVRFKNRSYCFETTLQSGSPRPSGLCAQQSGGAWCISWIRRYQSIGGFKLLESDGFLVPYSCSHPVSESEVWNSIRFAARDAKRDIRLIEQRSQSADHPILAGVPETRCLTYFIVQVL